MAKPTLLILAAGMGSRYGSLKQVDKLGPSGETIIEYSIFDALRAGFGKIVVVIRREIEDDFREFFKKLEGKVEIEYVYQELDNIPAGLSVPGDRKKPWGTAHAVLVAADTINTPFGVVNADDFYGKEAYETMGQHLQKIDNNSVEYCMIGYPLKNTLSDFGTVSRGVCETNESGNLVEVVERTKIGKDKGTIYFEDEKNTRHTLTGEELVSMNFWGFAPTVFDYLNDEFTAFINANINNPKAEFYIPTLIQALIEKNQAITKVYKTPSPWFGVTYKEDKPAAVNKLQELHDKGVYPGSLWK
ncbi:MAG: sugar phosphate nucleotidyltransferase [Bacteroidales bacterium]